MAVGEGVTDGEGVGVGLGVTPGAEGEVLGLAKAGGKPSSSVEASPARSKAYTTCPRTSRFCWAGSRW